jgi:hypothetical protein
MWNIFLIGLCFLNNYGDTDTIPIPMLDVERKTLPVFCPWCNSTAGVAEADVVRLDKTSLYYRAYGKCQDFINEGMVFIRGGNSSLRRWLVSFCRRIKI